MLQFRGVVQISTLKLQRLEKALMKVVSPQEARDLVEDLMKQGLEVVKKATPGTTRFKSGWHLRLERNSQDRLIRFQIEHEMGSADLIRWLELGTSDHTISARNAKVLKFQLGLRGGGANVSIGSGVGGSTVFAAYVHHPGTKPYLMLSYGVGHLNQELPNLIAQLKRRIERNWSVQARRL